MPAPSQWAEDDESRPSVAYKKNTSFKFDDVKMLECLMSVKRCVEDLNKDQDDITRTSLNAAYDAWPDETRRLKPAIEFCLDLTKTQFNRNLKFNHFYEDIVHLLQDMERRVDFINDRSGNSNKDAQTAGPRIKTAMTQLKELMTAAQRSAAATDTIGATDAALARLRQHNTSDPDNTRAPDNESHAAIVAQHTRYIANLEGETAATRRLYYQLQLENNALQRQYTALEKEHQILAVSNIAAILNERNEARAERDSARAEVAQLKAAGWRLPAQPSQPEPSLPWYRPMGTEQPPILEPTN